jgi:hypothetical protein
MGNVREKVEVEAMMSSDLEGLFKKYSQFDQFEKGSGKCYVCNRSMGVEDVRKIGGVSYRERRPDEPELYMERTFLQKISGRQPDKVGVTIEYCCEKFSCFHEFIHRD